MKSIPTTTFRYSANYTLNQIELPSHLNTIHRNLLLQHVEDLKVVVHAGVLDIGLLVLEQLLVPINLEFKLINTQFFIAQLSKMQIFNLNSDSPCSAASFTMVVSQSQHVLFTCLS